MKLKIKNKRYIRGAINNYIREQIRGKRSEGDDTTDKNIRREVLAKTGGMCYLCGRFFNPQLADILPHVYFGKLQIDHIVPFSKGGPNDISNYLPACSSCNNRKSDLPLSTIKKKR